MPKQNDLILTLLANPQFTTEDFQEVGLSANNTSLEDENTYINSKTITENPLFQKESGEFDEDKFHSVYIGASKMFQDLSDTTQNPKTVYSKYNIWAPLAQRDMTPQFELVKSPNPDRITKSMIVFGRNGEREKTPQEIAQSQQVFNSKTGEWMDSPEDLFSFKKLFNDPIGFFSDNFGNNKVLAQYDEDIDVNGNKRGSINFNENLIEHRKGEYMLNENGTYYYRTLKDGENIHGKQLLHYSDILTREGSALNSIDFLDSDDIEKSTFGTFVKDASLIGAMFIPGGVGTAIAGATIFQQAAGLGATLGKIALQDSSNSTLNWLEGLSESTNPLGTRSEYSSGDKMWTTENLLGMVADVIGQLYQQRLIFKWAPAITKGKWGLSEESQAALKEKYMAEVASKNKSSLDAIIAKYGSQSPQAVKASQELLAKNQLEAAALVEDFMKDYYKSGEQLSKAYMTILTVNDIYSEAKEAGASDFDASVITAGYAAMEYALLSTDIGKWVLPELRGDRLQNKAIVRALTKDTLETFKNLNKEATNSEAARRTYLQRLVDFGKNVARGEFNAGLGKRAAFEADSGLLKAGAGSIFAGASAEAIEETSEEVLADFSRVLFNGLEKLKGNDDIRMKKPWEDEHLFDRYAMSFLGGFIGGGISSAAFDFSSARRSLNMDYNKAVQEIIWKARNNDLDGIYKILNNEEIGNKNLSATKFVEDENGQKIWKQGTEKDNQDIAIKNIVKRQIKLLQDTLEAHGGNMSDERLIDQNVLKDIRFRALQNSTTAGIYIQKYNQALGKLIEKTNKLKSLNTPLEKAESGTTDKKERETGESEETKKRRQKLEKEIKELDEQIDNFTSGKLAPLFMTSALLESTPFISEVFMRSSFKTFAEDKAKTKFENISEGELKNYWDQYQTYLRTSKKDDLDFATEGYLNLQRLIKQNFEEAKRIAEESVNNDQLKQLLKEQTLSTTILNMTELDDDTWQETFQKFVNDNPLTEKFVTGIQLIRNTVKEAKQNADKKFEEDKALYDEKLANGEIEESVYQSYITGLNTVRDDAYTQANEGLNNALSDINFDMLVEQANQLADNFINLGFINGAIKDTVVNRLQESIDRLQEHLRELEELLNAVDTDKQDEVIEKQNRLNSQIIELKEKLEQVKNLKYTPILQNLDQFALNLKSYSVSQLLEELGNAIQTNKTNIGQFTFGEDIHHAINEADRVIDLYIAALEGARTDTVDPFKINTTTGKTEENLWGINKVLNEVHAKAPKIDGDTWEDLPEIDGNTANMMLMDARSIKSLLQSYKKLFDINRGQKLEIQSRVGARTSYLLYNKIQRLSRLLTNSDFPEVDKDGKTYEGIAEFQEAIDNLQFFNENVKGKNKEDWNINLSLEEQIALEKDRLTMETAIFEFFNKNTDRDWTPLFSTIFFNLGDTRTTLLTETAEDIDESSLVGYLISKLAINSSDFYSKLKDMLKSGDKKIAPLLGQEIGVQLHLDNVLNGNVLTKAIQAYRQSLYNHVKGLSLEERHKYLLKAGINSYAISTDYGFNKYFSSLDIMPQYSNITFTDGVAGSGKTTAIMATVIKFLQTYYPGKFNKVWTIHGGDSDTETTFSEGLRKAVGLAEDKTATFNKKTFMDKLTDDRKLTNDGNVYQFEENTDYKVINGRLVPTWKLKSYSKEELPNIIIIDEAQQFTQLELLTIDKFARENGIPVIMSGDLQQSQMTGEIKISNEDIAAINKELAEKGIKDSSGNVIKFDKTFPLNLHLSRNQVIHTPKIGTSMRTENNQKNMNMAAVEAAIDIVQEAKKSGEVPNAQIDLHYYIDDNNIAGDYWATENEDITSLLDKMIANLGEGEKINFAYSSENSEIYKTLKANSKYWDRINPIKGTALGQEGNYWILDIKHKQLNANGEEVDVPTETYLQDLYTGITRAKKASILIGPKSPVQGINLNTIQDSETHPEKYSEKAVEKFTDKRIKILEGALEGMNTKDIPNISRNVPPSNPPSNPTPEVPPTGPASPVGPAPVNPVPPVSPTPSPVSPSSGPSPKPIIEKSKKDSFLEGINKSISNQHIVAVLKAATEANIAGELTNDEFNEINKAAEQKLQKLNKRSDEEKVIQEGIAAVGEGLAEVSDEFTRHRIEYMLRRPNIEKEFKENIGVGVNSIEELVQRAISSILEEFNSLENPSEEEIKFKDDIIRLLNKSLEYDSTRAILESYITPKSETNPEEEIPPVVEEVEPEDIEEESESNEKETKAKLSDENRETNSATFDKVEISGFSKKDFNFFLFSNATFELGTNLINDDGTFNPSSVSQRIDSLNGIVKIFGINNLQEGINLLAQARNILMSVKNKSDMERQLGTLFNRKLRQLGKANLGNLFVRFAIKTSEPNVLNSKYDKAQKNYYNESVPYARCQVDPLSESNYANNRNLVAIIGDTEDRLEIPLLQLNNPITIILQKTSGQYKYPQIAYTYNNAYTRAYNYAAGQTNAAGQPIINDMEGYSQIEALKAVINTFTQSDYKGLTNLIKVYLDTNRKISFIRDQQWTIAKNLHNFGPQLNLQRGQKDNYDNVDYIQEDRWISLSELRQDPQLKITGVYHYTDKSGEFEDEAGNPVKIVTKPKHPFVLYTDAFYAHDGVTELNSDDNIINEFMYQKLHPEVEQTIKLVYVLPPTFTIGEYVESLIGFMVRGSKKGVLGNQRTPLKILEGLIYDVDGNVNSELIPVFQNAFGQETGIQVYNKVKETIDQLKNLSFEEQIQKLTNDTPQAWNINGVGLNANVQLYQQLQNIIKQLVQPSSITVWGTINHKGSSDIKDSQLQLLSQIFEKSGLSLFYQTKGSKDSSLIKYGRFSPIQESEDGVTINNDYLTTDREYKVNGNLSTSTFMADEEFNNIIEGMLKGYRPGSSTTPTTDGFAYFNDNYSGFNTKQQQQQQNPVQQQPSIHPDILDKLTKAGIQNFIINVNPTTINDNSINLKNQIAQEINELKSSHKALVLPNGELIIGKNDFFKDKDVQFNLGNNPFESGQNYQFDAIIDGEEYDVVYSETNNGKIMKLTPKQNQNEQINSYSEVDPNNLNIDRAKEFLTQLSNSSESLKDLINPILLGNPDTLVEETLELLNSDFFKMILEEENLDISQFNDILTFEQMPNQNQDMCNLSIKINFV